MRTSTVIARMSTGDPHAFAEARRKVANPDVCDLNRERLTAALAVLAPLEGTAPAAPADPTPTVDPVVAAAEAATKRLRALAGSIMASSQERNGSRPWDELMAEIPKAQRKRLNALMDERGKVTYAQACNVLGIERRKDAVPA